jgi:hypothetical protein
VYFSGTVLQAQDRSRFQTSSRRIEKPSACLLSIRELRDEMCKGNCSVPDARSSTDSGVERRWVARTLHSYHHGVAAANENHGSGNRHHRNRYFSAQFPRYHILFSPLDD